MKKFITIYSISLIIVMLFAVYHLKRCSEQQHENGKVTYKIIKKAVHDTVYVDNLVPADTVFVSLPADIDTAAILADYFTQYIYVDTVHANQYVDIKITDSIACNRITSHKIELLSMPDVYVPPNASSARCLALGGVAGLDVTIIKADFSIHRHTMSLGFDFKSKTPVFGYSFKLFSW